MVEENTPTLSASKGIDIDYPFIKVPFEQTRRVFRHSQRIIEQKLTSLTNINKGDPNEVSQTIQEVLKTLEDDHAECLLYSDRCKKRLKCLHNLNITMDDDKLRLKWDQTRIDRLVNEYLLSNGFFRSADTIASHSGLKTMDFADAELFTQLAAIELRLKDHSTSECLLWCFENRAHLKKNGSPLEFQLRRQTFVELARKRDLLQAIQYAKKFFPAWLDLHKREIEQCMALLAINSHTQAEPYKSIYCEKRWTDLVSLFRKEYLDLHCVSEKPQLISNLQAGLAALKTPICGSTNNLNINCPVCVLPYSELAANLPFSHHENSCLVCKISGEVMNENNPPMVLPNGSVFSNNALKDMAAKSHGKIKCLRTGQLFDYSEAKKVFIL